MLRTRPRYVGVMRQKPHGGTPETPWWYARNPMVVRQKPHDDTPEILFMCPGCGDSGVVRAVPMRRGSVVPTTGQRPARSRFPPRVPPLRAGRAMRVPIPPQRPAGHRSPRRPVWDRLIATGGRARGTSQQHGPRRRSCPRAAARARASPGGRMSVSWGGPSSSFASSGRRLCGPCMHFVG